MIKLNFIFHGTQLSNMLSIVDLVSNLGLPVGISLYLIYFITKELKQSIDKLTESLDKLCSVMDENHQELKILKKDVEELKNLSYRQTNYRQVNYQTK